MHRHQPEYQRKGFAAERSVPFFESRVSHGNLEKCRTDQHLCGLSVKNTVLDNSQSGSDALDDRPYSPLSTFSAQLQDLRLLFTDTLFAPIFLMAAAAGKIGSHSSHPSGLNNRYPGNVADANMTVVALIKRFPS
jgi:hypothetical protein